MIEISGEIEKKFKEELLNWTLSDDGIHRWISRDVSTDLGRVVNDIWNLAEDANHHPDMEIGYKGISVKLITHDKNAITDKELKEEIDYLEGNTNIAFMNAKMRQYSLYERLDTYQSIYINGRTSNKAKKSFSTWFDEFIRITTGK